MPAAKDHISDLNDIDLSSAPAEEKSVYPTSARKVKGKKGKKNAETLSRPVEDGGTQRERAIAQTSPPATALDEPETVAEPEHALVDDLSPTLPPQIESEDDEAEIESLQQPQRPSTASRTASLVSSPRPAVARPAPSSLTPPSRPSSLYSPPPQYVSPSNYRPSSTLAQARRESSTSHTSPRPRFVEPVAPPHMPQSHFYGLPDLGFGFGKKKEQIGKLAGSDGYCCCFDSFADSGDAASSKKAKNALLVGSEGALEVFRILPKDVQVVGRLEGLRGSVIGAAILPHVDIYDAMQAVRPLVAVIVHGPMIMPRSADKTKDDGKEPSHYQTTVEVYSLQTQEHITTLYRSIPAEVKPPTIGQMSELPQPIGELSVSAHGRFVVVASGKSGEILIFSNASTSLHTEPQFRCLGKYWTLLQTPLESVSRPTSSSDAIQTGDDVDEKAGIPLFTLSQRWLALLSPPTSSHISIQGTPLTSEQNANPAGLISHVAPPQHPITCDIAGVDTEGTFSRLRRQATQGVVKYSQMGIEMGWQGWKELTNPTAQNTQQHGRTSSKDDQFPPTNAPLDDPRRFAKEPAVVSIIDLQTLLEAEEQKPKYPPAPLATFALDEGCNFISFSSNGLRLLTVSRKGEVSTIWDLAQASHGKYTYTAIKEDEITPGPCIKVLNRIPRTSQSLVVDSAWSRDDDYLAMLTTHGTVHLHEVLPRSSSRKRKRASTTNAPPPEKAEATVSVSHGMSPPSSNGFLGGIKSGWQQVSTQVSTIRSQNPVASLGIPLSFAGLQQTAANASHAGGRALAKGLSQGFSAAKGGASDYWHAEDNKIRHKALHDQNRPGVLRWTKRQSGTYLAVACGGTVHLHPVERVERRISEKLVSGLKHDKYGRKHFELPPIQTSVDTAGPQKRKKDDSCAKAGPHGFWSLRISPDTRERRVSENVTAPIPSQANEVETNPPYCPFHIDPSVNIFAFDDTTMGSQMNLLEDPDMNKFQMQGHGLPEPEAWVFGEPLPPSTKMNTHEHLNLSEYHQGINDSDLETLAEQMTSELTVHAVDEPGGEQIRINTRPARVRLGDAESGEGEFDMFDDENDGNDDL